MNACDCRSLLCDIGPQILTGNHYPSWLGCRACMIWFQSSNVDSILFLCKLHPKVKLCAAYVYGNNPMDRSEYGLSQWEEAFFM